MNQPSSAQCKATSANRQVFTFLLVPASHHAPGHPFTIGKWLGIKFGTELLEAIVVVFLLAETGIAISDRRSLTAVF